MTMPAAPRSANSAGDRRAQTLRAAGDDGDLAVEAAILAHVFPPLMMMRILPRRAGGVQVVRCEAGAQLSFFCACARSAAVRRRAPVLGERLAHQLRLGLRRKAAERRIAVEVGREGVALGTGGDGVVALSPVEAPVASTAFKAG